MTEKQRTGNKLMALYEDTTVWGIHKDPQTVKVPLRGKEIEVYEKLGYIADIRYHSDWNWIIAVCQKLLPELRATQREGELESNIGAIEMALLDLNIDKVYEATVKAIISLNELKEEINETKGI